MYPHFAVIDAVKNNEHIQATDYLGQHYHFNRSSMAEGKNVKNKIGRMVSFDNTPTGPIAVRLLDRDFQGKKLKEFPYVVRSALPVCWHYSKSQNPTLNGLMKKLKVFIANCDAPKTKEEYELSYRVFYRYSKTLDYLKQLN